VQAVSILIKHVLGANSAHACGVGWQATTASIVDLLPHAA